MIPLLCTDPCGEGACSRWGAKRLQNRL